MLSSARACTNVTLAGKRDSRRHSTARVLAITVPTFLVNQKHNEAFRSVYFLRIRQKLFKSHTRSRSRPRIKRSLI